MASSDDGDAEGQTAWLRSYLSMSWFFLAIFLIFFIRSFAKNQFFRWYNYATVYVCYGAALGIVVAVPIDVAYTIKARTARVDLLTSYNDETEVLVGQYRTLYWMALILGVLMYWVEIYSSNGYVLLHDRFIDTSRRMAKDYFAMAVVGIAFIWILIATNSVPKDSDAVSSTVVSVSNTVGLCVIVVCLGYALIAFPIQLWQSADLDAEVRLLKSKAASEFVRFKAAQLSLQQIVASSLLTMEVAKRQGDLYPECDLLFSHLPEGMTSVVGGVVEAASMKNNSCHFLGMRLYGSDKLAKENQKVAGRKRMSVRNARGEVPVITKHDLANLLNRLLKAKAKFFICNGRWERSKKRAFYIMDVTDAMDAANEGSVHGDVQRWAPIRWTQDGSTGGRYAYNYHTYYLPNFMRFLAVFCASLSALTLLGEASTIGNSYNSGVAVYSDAVHDENASVFGITLFSMITLGYITCLLFWGMFQIKLLDMYDMIPNNNTTPKAMSFNARQVAKLCPPLVFNFLGMLYESGVHEGTWIKDVSGEFYYLGFTRMYGNLLPQSLGLRAVGRYAVIVILIVSGLRLLNVHNRLLCLIGLKKYQFGAVIDDSFKSKDMEEGEKQLMRHREMQRRTADRKQKLQVDKSGADRRSESLVNRSSEDKMSRNKTSPNDKQSIISQVNQDDDKEEPPSFKNLWGNRFFKQARDAVRNPTSQKITSDDLGFEAPEPLTGWIQVKKSKDKANMMKYFAHLKSPGVVYLYSDESSQLQHEADLASHINQNTVRPLDSFDLSLAVAVSVQDGESNTIRLDYDDEAHVQRIYVSEPAMYSKWLERLESWHSFAADPSLLAQKADEVESLVHGKHSYRPGEQKRMTANAALASIASLEFEDDLELMGGQRRSSSRRSSHGGGGGDGGGGGGGGSRLSHSKPNPIAVTSRTMSLESAGEEAPPQMLEGWLEVLVDDNAGEVNGSDTTMVKKKKPLYKRKPKFMKNFKKKSITEDNDDLGEEVFGKELFEKKYVFIDPLKASLVYDTKKSKSLKYEASKHLDCFKDLRLVGNIEIFHDENLESLKKDKAAEDLDVEAGLKLASCFFVVDDWKFKAESSEAALKWVDSLEDWRDWLLLHAPF